MQHKIIQSKGLQSKSREVSGLHISVIKHTKAHAVSISVTLLVSDETALEHNAT
jgi:CRISPR/Cas system CMR-associated protein Cmr1 (group 7 of RAMP superfamily)